MTNFGTKIFNTAVSSINAQQGVLAGISNNIANANTPGYSRRAVLLTNQTSGEGTTGLNIGSGVKISDLIRFVDEFTNKTFREAEQTRSFASSKDDLLARVEDVFNLTGTSQTIGSTLTDFFASLNDLSINPSSIELRSNMIERGKDLVNAIQSSYGAVANVQRDIDARIVSDVDAINNLTSQIAELNLKVVQRENSGSLAADERDRRDNLLGELSKKISFTTLELADGSVKVSLPSGLDLVFGSNSRNLEVTTSPTFAGGGSLPPALWGGVPAFIVYNYGSAASPAHVDLTSEIGAGEGSLGGYLQVRGIYDVTDTSPFQGDGILPQIGARIEAITRFLLSDFNTTYLGADEDSITGGHQASSADLNGLAPSIYGFFDFNFAGVKDTDGDGLPDDIGTHAGVTNYSSLLRLTSTDPRSIAASLDLDPADGVTSFAQGDGSNLAQLSDLQRSVKTFTVDNYSFNGTVDQVYVDAVGYVGNEKSKSATNRIVADSNYKLTADRRDSISGVSLDEEFAQLVRFQKAFEASARLIRMGNELLDQIVNLL